MKFEEISCEISDIMPRQSSEDVSTPSRRLYELVPVIIQHRQTASIAYGGSEQCSSPLLAVFSDNPASPSHQDVNPSDPVASDEADHQW